VSVNIHTVIAGTDVTPAGFYWELLSIFPGNVLVLRVSVLFLVSVKDARVSLTSLLTVMHNGSKTRQTEISSASMVTLSHWMWPTHSVIFINQLIRQIETSNIIWGNGIN